MATHATKIAVLLANPADAEPEEIEVLVRYDSKDPYAISIIFAEGEPEEQIWVFSIDLFRDASRGRSSGHGDVVFSPSLEIRHSMNLFLTNGQEHATLVLPIPDMEFALQGISEAEDTIPTVVNSELDVLLYDILEG